MSLLHRHPAAYLRKRADELRQMAQAAASSETRAALLRLANRFVAVAEGAVVSEGRGEGNRRFSD